MRLPTSDNIEYRLKIPPPRQCSEIAYTQRRLTHVNIIMIEIILI